MPVAALRLQFPAPLANLLIPAVELFLVRPLADQQQLLALWAERPLIPAAATAARIGPATTLIARVLGLVVRFFARLLGQLGGRVLAGPHQPRLQTGLPVHVATPEPNDLITRDRARNANPVVEC